jgi:hypothetical protein
MNKFNNLLIRANSFQDGCTNSFLTNAFHKLADDWQSNISFKKGKADFAQSSINIVLRKRTTLTKAGEDRL